MRIKLLFGIGRVDKNQQNNRYCVELCMFCFASAGYGVSSYLRKDLASLASHIATVRKKEDRWIRWRFLFLPSNSNQYWGNEDWGLGKASRNGKGIKQMGWVLLCCIIVWNLSLGIASCAKLVCFSHCQESDISHCCPSFQCSFLPLFVFYYLTLSLCSRFSLQQLLVPRPLHLVGRRALFSTLNPLEIISLNPVGSENPLGRHSCFVPYFLIFLDFSFHLGGSFSYWLLFQRNGMTSTPHRNKHDASFGHGVRDCGVSLKSDRPLSNIETEDRTLDGAVWSAGT